MNLIERYTSAWGRLRRSHGYGIHSPFAFRFVLDVLCERLPYYSYGYINDLRQAVVETVRTGFWRHPRVISAKNARMLFRITNYFNPSCVLQVGTSYGVSCACMMAVNSRSRLWLYEPHLDAYPVVARVLAPYLERVATHDDLPHAISAWRRAAADAGEPPFVLVNDLPGGEGDYDTARGLLLDVIDAGGTAVLRNLSRSALMRRLWDDCAAHGTHGQLFTNGRIAVVVAGRKLQREIFTLWF